MTDDDLRKIVQERDDLHGVVHAFVSEFKNLKEQIEKLEDELRQIHQSMDGPQLDLDLPQKDK